MITQKHTQESLSRSYVHAIAGSAGVNLHIGREFDYGFDGTFRPVTVRNKRHVETGFPVDFQLKCTTKWIYEGSDIAYNIETKTYNDLVTRKPEEIGCVLIILCVPEDNSQWVDVQEQHMILKHCCYFCSLSGTTTVSDDLKKKILIPRSNILTALALKGLLENERTRKMKGGDS